MLIFNNLIMLIFIFYLNLILITRVLMFSSGIAEVIRSDLGLTCFNASLVFKLYVT